VSDPSDSFGGYGYKGSWGPVKNRTFIYIISEHENGPLKIGRSMNPQSRLGELQVGNPRRLHLVKTWEIENHDLAHHVERWLYQILKRGATFCGGEWFNLSEILACEFVELAVDDIRRGKRL